MMNLPMTAFCFYGFGDYISFELYEVFGFPQEIAYGGGYGAKGLINMSIGSYNVHADCFLTTGELFSFYEQLKDCYDAISGEARLTTTEQQVFINIFVYQTGKVVIKGFFQERLDVDTKLLFEMITDQTAIEEAINSLSRVYDLFGDNRGKAQK